MTHAHISLICSVLSLHPWLPAKYHQQIASLAHMAAALSMAVGSTVQGGPGRRRTPDLRRRDPFKAAMELDGGGAEELVAEEWWRRTPDPVEGIRSSRRWSSTARTRRRGTTATATVRKNSSQRNGGDDDSASRPRRRWTAACPITIVASQSTQRNEKDVNFYGTRTRMWVKCGARGTAHLFHI